MGRSIGVRVAVVGFGAAAFLAATGCNNGGSSKRVINARVGAAAAMVADPAQNRILVTDTANPRLVTFDSLSGAALDAAPMAARPEGVAGDLGGVRVYVSLPTLSAIDVLNARNLNRVNRLTLADAPHALLWRDADRLVAATDAGLAVIDAATGVETLILPSVPGTATLAQDRAHRRVFAAFTIGGQLEIASIDPDQAGDVGTVNTIGARSGNVAGLLTSFDDSQLLVATAGSASIDVIDAATLALVKSVALPSTVVAFSGNATSTRVYFSAGGITFGAIPADTLAGPAEDFTTIGNIVPEGLVVDADGAHALVHLDDGSMRAVPLFEDQLLGEPIVRLDREYQLTLNGTPSEPFFLAAADTGGFINYGPPSITPRRFLDLDPVGLTVVTAGTLDGSGQKIFAGTVPSSSGLAGQSFVLQAIVLDPANGKLGAPTNPLRITLVAP